MSKLPKNYASQAGEAVESIALAIEPTLDAYCESPIETSFLVTFKLLAGMLGDPVGTVVGGEPINEVAGSREWFIEPQCQIDSYRVDFAIGPWPKDGRLLIIECDGHDFHERTKEQAARDRSRDRFLQSCGFKVFRFTGMELHREVFVCAYEVFKEMVKWRPDR